MFSFLNKSKFTKEERELQHYYAKYELYQKGLSERIVKYIAYGQEPGIMNELKQNLRAINGAINEALRQACQNKSQKSFEDKYFYPDGRRNWVQKRLSNKKENDLDALSRCVNIENALTNNRPYNMMNANNPQLSQWFDLCHDAGRGNNRNHPKDFDWAGNEASFLDVLIARGFTKRELAEFYIVRPKSWRGPIMPQLRFPEVVDVVIEKLGHDEVLRAANQLNSDMLPTLISAFGHCDYENNASWYEWLSKHAFSSSKAVRETAQDILIKKAPKRIEATALDYINDGKADIRFAAVRILGHLNTDVAKAALAERAEVEKSSKVATLIEQFGRSDAAEAVQEGVEGGYRSVTGEVVEIPQPIKLEDDGSKPFGQADVDELQRFKEKKIADYEKQLAKYEQALSEYNKAANKQQLFQPYKPYAPSFKNNEPKEVVEHLNKPVPDMSEATEEALKWYRRRYGDNASFWESALERMPLHRAVRIALLASPNLTSALSPYSSTPQSEFILGKLSEGEIDLAWLVEECDRLGVVLNYRYSYYGQLETKAEKHGPDALIHSWVGQGSLVDAYRARGILSLGRGTIWPYGARHLSALFDYMPPKSTNARQSASAMKLLSRFPALPEAVVPSVLAVATGEAKTGQREARELLRQVPGLAGRLLELLDDKRQVVRANVAGRLGESTEPDQISAVTTALTKRIKKEKSLLAKAAMLSALEKIGADTSAWTSRAAQENEAAAALAKLPADKLDWMARETAPALKWADGTPVAKDVIEYWLRLAVKLNSPDAAPYFRIMLKDVEAPGASEFGTWVLRNWIHHDSRLPSREQAVAEATRIVESWYSNPNSARSRNKTQQQIDAVKAQEIEWMTGDIGSRYLGSAAPVKGLLAIAALGDSAHCVPAARTYLKDHGKRVAQAKSVLDMMSMSGTSDAIQLLVATSTRFKQRTVRDHAEKLLAEIAEDRGWTTEMLADYSVPDAGLNEDGTLLLTMAGGKTYTARLASDLTLHLFNSDGKQVKSLPSSKEPEVKAAKAAFSAAKKVIKEQTALQKSRLHEAMLTERRWSVEDFQTHMRNHPLMSRLTERVVWRSVDADNATLTLFRPTAEGEMWNAEGDEVSIDGADAIMIAHSSTLTEEERDAWTEHLEDFEVTPLFAQLSRKPRELTKDLETKREIDTAKGTVMESLTLRGLASKLDYQQGASEDGGYYYDFHKSFRQSGIMAVISFTGTFPGNENHPVALTTLKFVGIGEGGNTNTYARGMALSKVPKLILWEAWNDYEDMAAKGNKRDDWEKLAW